MKNTEQTGKVLQSCIQKDGHNMSHGQHPTSIDTQMTEQQQ